jgi:hypothetical protein
MMRPFLLPSLLGAAGAYSLAACLQAVAGSLGLPALPLLLWLGLALALFAAFACLPALLSPDGARPAAQRCLAYAGFFLILWLRPWVERMSLPPPHDLLERKQELLLAGPAAFYLIALAAEQAFALRRRLRAGRGAGLWPVLLPLLWLSLTVPWTNRWNMTGDAPHYMLMTLSLVQDGDLDLENNYAAGDAAAFYPRMPLLYQEHKREDGRRISWHRPGLPLLLAPAYAAGGPSLAIAVVCVLAALLGGALWALLRAAGLSPDATWKAWALLMLSPPFYSQGSMVLAEFPAAILLALAFWALLRAGQKGWAAAFGFAAFALPWLNGRYNLFLPALALALLAEPRARRWGAWPAWAGMALGQLTMSLWVWLEFQTLSPVGGLDHSGTGFSNFRFDWLDQSVFGQLWDQEFGLAFGAIFWLPALLGLAAAVGRGRRRILGLAALLIVVMNYAVLCNWGAWWGQMAAPNRMYSPLLPLAALGLGWAAAQDAAPRWLWALAWAQGLLLSAIYTALPWLAFNQATGANRIFEVLRFKLGFDLAACLPSFMHPRPLDLGLGAALSFLLVWGMARAAGWVRR